MTDAKTAPASGTPIALSYLESYLDGKPNRKKATMALLGCSERTAGRIVSRSRPYRAPMKMAWVSRLCNAVRRPIGDVLGTRAPRTWEQCLLGWNHARTNEEALQLAADCALAIVYRASQQYQLSGSFGVTYHDGYPSEVIIMLSTAPALAKMGGPFSLHQIIISAEKAYSGNGRRMMIQHIGPGVEIPDKTFLNSTILEKTLATIHALTKNFTADLQRETARRSTA
jgi:hypothetical protein